MSMRSGLKCTPGPSASRSSGLSASLMVSNSPWGRATSGSIEPELVAVGVGSTVRVIVIPWFATPSAEVRRQGGGLPLKQRCWGGAAEVLTDRDILLAFGDI